MSGGHCASGSGRMHEYGKVRAGAQVFAVLAATTGPVVVQSQRSISLTV